MAAAAAEVSRIVDLLQNGSISDQESAATALIGLATNDLRMQMAFHTAGALPPLVALLASTSDSAAAAAAWALGVLSESQDHIRLAIHNTGALPGLVTLLERGSGAAQLNAAWTLCFLAAGEDPANEQMPAAIYEAGALPPLVTLLTSGSCDAQEIAARAFLNLGADNDKEVKRAIINAGALPPLFSLLNSSNSAAQEIAAKAIGNVVSIIAGEITCSVIGAGSLPPLITLLTRGSSKAQENAVWALASLAAGSDEMKRSIISAGALAPLVTLSRSGTEGAKVMALHAIRALEEVCAPEDPQAKIQRLEAELALRDLAMAHLQASIFPQISRIEFCLHDVPLPSPVGMYVSHLLRSTVVQHRVQLGQPDFAPAPQLRAVKIEKLVSERLYETYMTGIHSLGGRYREPGCAFFDAFPHLRVHPASLCTGRVDLNEHFVFHGATADVVSEICRAGFDPQRGGEGVGKLFGIATYFAPNSSKSDIYTEDFTRRLPRGAERKMIVARVILGQSYRVAEQCPQRTRPPDGFDSVWADSRQNGGCVDHPEIMIYKEQQALPQYVVTYVHDCLADQLCAECLKRPPN